MASKAPPVIDEHGRARYIRPASSIQPDLYGDLNDLMFAAAHGRINIVGALLGAGANVNARIHDSTALMLAAGNGHIDVVKVLLDKGANIEERDMAGKTSLAFAAGLGDLEMVKALLGAGADANAGDNWGTTPLMWAVGEGHPEIVKALLDADADVNAKNSNGYTALSLVPAKRLFSIPMLGEFYSNKRNKEMTQLLKEAGAVF